MALLLAIAPPAGAAGFAIFEQGSNSMGMAMAFTAQADDPSAMFHNVGGLGFFEERSFMVGVTFISLGDSQFQGAAPSPGPGVTGEQTDRILVPPHFYWVEPLGDQHRWTFGLGLNAPFGLATEWEDPDQWSGRFISEKAELRAFDLNPSLAWRASDRFALGLGVVVRVSDVELKNRSATLNPFTMSFVEIAKTRLTSDMDNGVGFNLGLLHRATDRFSWGLSYRSKIEIDYSGDARLTQVLTGDPVFDAIVAATTPFDQNLPIETAIEFPDMASLGFAYRFTDSLLGEADLNWTGWSSFDTLDIVFPDNPGFDESLVEEWEDVNNYRFGLRWTVSDRSEWRFGFYIDETPQPEASVSPLLPDADRNGYTVGYGHTFGDVHADFTLLYVDFKNRTTANNRDNFNGAYQTKVWLLGTSIRW
jgi:long-chain fatty acid transport protein